ncbi:MAG: hypothetical protein U1E48_08210 [Paracoccaceae bacterium]
MTDAAIEDDPPPAAIALPPVLPFEAAPGAARFLIEAPKASLWFERRSDVLIVSFDNLATIDEGWPRGPWLDRRLAELGYSVLGVQSRAKDWYRQDDAPALLRRLEETGFFRAFRRVVLTGASMGGFGALNFAPLIPDSRVLAFSAQSTMNKVIAPFEQRFPFAVRKSNWEGMPFLDAAAAIPYIRKVFLVYDPFTPEDRAHARRMAGANVQLLRAGHATHEAVRVVLKSGALPALLREVVERDHVGPAFWQAYRARRTVSKWQRAITEAMAAGRHPKLTMGACKVMLGTEDLMFARRAFRQARAQLQDKASGARP